MEAAKCRLCGERHYGLCKQFQEVVQKPLKKNKEEASIKVAVLKSTTPSEFKSLEMPPVGCAPECPICAARRKLKSLQMKRYRAKKKESK